jgi:hypothetical protein
MLSMKGSTSASTRRGVGVARTLSWLATPVWCVTSGRSPGSKARPAGMASFSAVRAQAAADHQHTQRAVAVRQA